MILPAVCWNFLFPALRVQIHFWKSEILINTDFLLKMPSSIKHNKTELKHKKGWMAEGRWPDYSESSPSCRYTQSTCFSNPRRIAHLEPPHSTSQGIRSRMLHVSGNWFIYDFMQLSVLQLNSNCAHFMGFHLLYWPAHESFRRLIKSNSMKI